MDGRTIGVELKDVDIAVCVCDSHVELFAIGKHICSYDLDMAR